MTTMRTAPRPMAPYVMRLELSPPVLAGSEVSMLFLDEEEEGEAVEEVPEVESVEVVEDDDDVVDVVALHESAVPWADSQTSRQADRSDTNRQEVMAIADYQSIIAAPTYSSRSERL